MIVTEGNTLGENRNTPAKNISLMTHMLLLQPKVTTSDAQLEQLFEAVRTMQHHIPHLVAVAAGENHSHQHRGWTYGIIFHFENDRDLQDVFRHTAYLQMLQQLRALCEAWIIFDIPQRLPHIQESPPLSVSSLPDPKERVRARQKTRRPYPAPVVRQINPRLIALVVEQLNVEAYQVVPTASLVTDLRADSIDLVEFILTLEQTFQIKIADEDLDRLLTNIAEIQRYLVEKGALPEA